LSSHDGNRLVENQCVLARIRLWCSPWSGEVAVLCMPVIRCGRETVLECSGVPFYGVSDGGMVTFGVVTIWRRKVVTCLDEKKQGTVALVS
jgi:hypothetical protein